MLGGFFRMFPIWTDYYIAMGVSAFTVIVIVHYFGVESSRWLLLNEPEKVAENRRLLDRFRTEEVKRELDEELEIIELNNSVNKTKQDFLTVFRSKMLVKRMLLATIIWTLTNIIYFAFTMNIVSLSSGSIYSNYVFTGFMDIIGYLFPVFIFKYFNRTQTQLVILSVMLFSVFLALIFDSDYSETLTSLIRWTGKLMASGLFTVIYVHTPEMFPTALRGQCLAFPDGISRLAAAVTPFFGVLYQDNESMFWWLHVFMISAGFIATFFMPETETVYPDTKTQCRQQFSMVDAVLQ